MSEKNYYEVLQIEVGATAEQIKASFRSLAKQYHPDANKDNPNADAIFKLVNEAYEILGDPDKRPAYDKTLYVSKLRAPNTSLEGTGIYLDEYDRFPDKVKLEDGGGDIVVNIPVIPTELVAGALKDIKFDRKEVCDACAGSGSRHSAQCQTCDGTGKLKFFMDTAKGVETHERRCKMCAGTGVQVVKECPKCQGCGMVRVPKALRVPVPKGSRDGMIMVKKGDGDRSRLPNKLPGNLKLIVKLMKLRAAPPPVRK